MTDSSSPASPSSITTRRPASPKAVPASLAPTSSTASAREAVTSTPLPAASPSVLTTYGPASAAQEGDRRVRRESNTAVGRGRHAGIGQHLLHPGLGPLQPGPVGAGAEHQLAGGPQPVGQPGDQRRLGADHVQVGVDLLGRLGGALDVRPPAQPTPAMPGLPGATTTDAVRARADGHGVLAAARADDADPHHDAKDTNWSRPGPDPDQPDRHAGLVGEECHVLLGRGRQVVQLGRARQVGLPARQLLVHRA